MKALYYLIINSNKGHGQVVTEITRSKYAELFQELREEGFSFKTYEEQKEYSIDRVLIITYLEILP